MLATAVLASLIAAAPAAQSSPATSQQVHSLRIQVLSTMLSEEWIGEWGFGAIVEVDGHRILFDTGAHKTTVLDNAREMKVDLGDVPEVVLSHNHSDHTGGLLTLRNSVKDAHPEALRRVHVGRGLFWSRPTSGGGEANLPLREKDNYAAAGLVFVEHDKPEQILPGVWLTGPVPRVHPERNWSVKGQVRTPDGLVEDTIPEDQALVFDTDQGLVILAGCGHAGIINTVDYARKVVRDAPIHAIVGGLHLFPLPDDRLDWTADQLKAAGLQNLLGAHCTGIEAVFRIRQRAGLTRKTSVVGSVGSTFELGKGIDPLELAQ